MYAPCENEQNADFLFPCHVSDVLVLEAASNGKQKQKRSNLFYTLEES